VSAARNDRGPRIALRQLTIPEPEVQLVELLQFRDWSDVYPVEPDDRHGAVGRGPHGERAPREENPLGEPDRVSTRDLHAGMLAHQHTNRLLGDADEAVLVREQDRCAVPRDPARVRTAELREDIPIIPVIEERLDAVVVRDRHLVLGGPLPRPLLEEHQLGVGSAELEVRQRPPRPRPVALGDGVDPLAVQRGLLVHRDVGDEPATLLQHGRLTGEGAHAEMNVAEAPVAATREILPHGCVDPLRPLRDVPLQLVPLVEEGGATRGPLQVAVEREDAHRTVLGDSRPHASERVRPIVGPGRSRRVHRALTNREYFPVGGLHSNVHYSQPSPLTPATRVISSCFSTDLVAR